MNTFESDVKIHHIAMRLLEFWRISNSYPNSICIRSISHIKFETKQTEEEMFRSFLKGLDGVNVNDINTLMLL